MFCHVDKSKNNHLIFLFFVLCLSWVNGAAARDMPDTDYASFSDADSSASSSSDLTEAEITQVANNAIAQAAALVATEIASSDTGHGQAAAFADDDQADGFADYEHEGKIEDFTEAMAKQTDDFYGTLDEGEEDVQALSPSTRARLKGFGKFVFSIVRPILVEAGKAAAGAAIPAIVNGISSGKSAADVFKSAGMAAGKAASAAALSTGLQVLSKQTDPAVRSIVEDAVIAAPKAVVTPVTEKVRREFSRQRAPTRPRD